MPFGARSTGWKNTSGRADLLSEYDFSDEKLQHNVGIRPPKIDPLKMPKIWGLPNRVMCFSHRALVENCVGLYVPLLEFNQIDIPYTAQASYSIRIRVRQFLKHRNP